jgi:hypothetical protein
MKLHAFFLFQLNISSFNINRKRSPKKLCFHQGYTLFAFKAALEASLLLIQGKKKRIIPEKKIIDPAK